MGFIGFDNPSASDSYFFGQIASFFKERYYYRATCLTLHVLLMFFF